MLGEYESLRVAESRFQRGSVDILAFNATRNLMLIVGCTLSAPRDEDFANIVTLRTIFLEEIFAGSVISIIPVIFTGLRTSPAYWEPIFDEHDATHCTVPVFDGSRIAAALELIPSKREREFFSFLADPQGTGFPRAANYS
jgi:hypothetical protein